MRQLLSVQGVCAHYSMFVCIIIIILFYILKMSERVNNTLMDNIDKRKHLSLSIEQKVNLLKKLDSGVSVRRLTEEFGVGTTTIYDLKKQKDKLFKFYAESEEQKLMKDRKTLHKSKNENLDWVLKEWIRQRRSKRMPLTCQLIMEQAKIFHRELKIEGNCEYSSGWLQKFKKRHGIKDLQINDDDEESNNHEETEKSGDQLDDEKTDNIEEDIMFDPTTYEKNIPSKSVCKFGKLHIENVYSINNEALVNHSMTDSEVAEMDLNQGDQDKINDEYDIFYNEVKLHIDDIVKKWDELIEELEQHACIMKQESMAIYKIKGTLIQQKKLLRSQMTLGKMRKKAFQNNVSSSFKDSSIPGLSTSLDAHPQDVIEVKNKWKHLRDSFNRELRRCPSSQYGESTSKWVHFQDMQFIKDGLTSSATAENSTAEFQEEQDSHINNNGDKSFVKIMDIFQQDEDLEDDLQHPVKKKKISHLPEEHRTINSLEDLEMRRNDYNDQPFKYSEDYHFLMSLVPSLEKLPIRQKLIVKIEIQKLIYEAMFGEQFQQFKENYSPSTVLVKSEIVETETST